MTWFAAVAVVAVLATVPFRAMRHLEMADLEHRAIDLSGWHHDDLKSYRLGGRAFALYIPAAGTAVVPVRRAPGAPDPLRLELRVDGRLIDSVHIGGDEWTALRLTRRGDRRRFVLLEVRIANAPDHSSAAPLLRVGKVFAH